MVQCRNEQNERMITLSLQDIHHLDTAIGWCELKSFLEANEELDKIAPQARSHPRVLEIRWQVYANLEKWEGALEIANALTKHASICPEGWIYRASTLVELNRHDEAYETLIEAANNFPTDEIIHYDLACVCCQLKRNEEARRWLQQAIDLGGNEIKLKALEDGDLETIWKNL